MRDEAQSAVKLTKLEYQLEKLKFFLFAGDYGESSLWLANGKEEKETLQIDLNQQLDDMSKWMTENKDLDDSIK